LRRPADGSLSGKRQASRCHLGDDLADRGLRAWGEASNTAGVLC
jgi:hypothetical protein